MSSYYLNFPLPPLDEYPFENPDLLSDVSDSFDQLDYTSDEATKRMFINPDEYQALAEPISTEARLEKFPEMQLMPITRQVFTDPRGARILTEYPKYEEYKNESFFTLADFHYDMEMMKPLVLPPDPTEDIEIENLTTDEIQYDVLAGDDLKEEYITKLPTDYYTRRTTCYAFAAGFHSQAARCEKCHNCFRTTNMLARHRQDHDRAVASCTAPTLPCPINACPVICDSLNTVVEHVRHSHNRDDLVFEVIEFPSVSVFEKWHEEMEDMTFSRFSKTSGKRQTHGKSTFYHRYTCYLAKTAAKSPKTRKRSRQSKKLDKTCTAFFTALVRADGTVLVRGCFKHVGHDIDFSKTPLSRKIKKEIAFYLLNGMDEQKVYECVRKDSDPTERRFYLQMYEIRNISAKIFKNSDLQRDDNEEVDDETFDEGIEDEQEHICSKYVKNDQQCQMVPKTEDEMILETMDFPPYVSNEEEVTSCH